MNAIQDSTSVYYSVSKLIDRIGTRYGRLVVTGRAPRNRHGGTMWLCQCDCGKEKAVAVTSLRKGLTTSCGCYHREAVGRMQRSDLIGQRFDRWVVNSFAFMRANRTYWFCQCDCGNEKSIAGSVLASGGSKSCGCLRTEFGMGKLQDLIGQTFGSLTVIARGENNRHKHVMWVCRCECGEEVIVPGGNLKYGNTTSCGCKSAYGFNASKHAILYYIKLSHPQGGPSLYKIGVTNRTVEQRFYGEESVAGIIKIWEYHKGADAYVREQNILKIHDAARYKGPAFLTGGNEEIFIRDVLQLDSTT